MACVSGFPAVLLVKNRIETQDIDVFGSTESSAAIGEVCRLADAISSEVDMSQGWLNNRAQLYLKQEYRDGLYNSAKTVPFKAKGLKVLAADWTYMIASKCDRISGMGGPKHDIQDAAGFIRLLRLERHAAGPLAADELKSWCSMYGTSINDNTINMIATAYEQKYGQMGIELQAEKDSRAPGMQGR